MDDLSIDAEPTQWITATAVLVATFVVTWVVRRYSERLLRSVGLETTTARPLSRLAGAAVFVGGFMYALRAVDIAIGPLLGALGVAGLALAFALQDIIENLIAGIMLQARQPFAIGDQVAVGDHTGTVQDITIRSTILKTFDGYTVTIPSSDVLQSPIENRTAFPSRRTTLMVGVSYDADLDDVTTRVADAAARAAGVVPQPAPDAWVESFGDSSIDIAVRFWHGSTIAAEWSTRHAVAIAVKQALDDLGVEIPFPTHTLQLPTAQP